jgi:hypothetical protein
MSLNIESDKTPHAENLNYPSDVYIYFQGGFYVWSWTGEDLNVWYQGDMFTFSRRYHPTPKAACADFNEWSGKQTRLWEKAVPIGA